MLFEWMEDGLQKEAANKVPLKAIMAASLEFDERFAKFANNPERLEFAKADIVAMCHRVASEFGVDGDVVADHLLKRLAAPMTEVETTDPKRVDIKTTIGGEEGNKYKNWDVEQKNDEIVSEMQDFPYGGSIEEPFKPGSMTGTITDGPEYDVNNQGGAELAPYAENTTEKPSFGTSVDMPVADGVTTLSSTEKTAMDDVDWAEMQEEDRFNPPGGMKLHDLTPEDEMHPEDLAHEGEMGPEELLQRLLDSGYSKEDILAVLDNKMPEVTRPPMGESAPGGGQDPWRV